MAGVVGVGVDGSGEKGLLHNLEKPTIFTSPLSLPIPVSVGSRSCPYAGITSYQNPSPTLQPCKI